jgi:hypothetical protein
MKRYISAILVPCLLLQIFGCYSFQSISGERLNNQNGKDDIKLVDNNDFQYLFRAEDYTIKNDSLRGKGIKSKLNDERHKELFKGKIALTDMKSIQTDRFNIVNTSLLILSIVGTIYLLVRLSFESTPHKFNLGSL